MNRSFSWRRMAQSGTYNFFFVQKLYVPGITQSPQFWGYLLLVVEPTPIVNVVASPVTPESITLLINRSATIAYAANQALIGTAFTPRHYRAIQQSIEQSALTDGILLGQQRYYYQKRYWDLISYCMA